LTNKQLHDLYEGVFEHIVMQKLSNLMVKHGSELSRTLVTVVLDDSVFKHWLATQMSAVDEEACVYYKRCFSGQVQQVVWGHQVVVVGVNIGDVFFPLYFECVRKTPESVKAAQVKYVKIGQEWKAECAKKVALLAEIKAKKANSTTETDKAAIKNLRQDLKALNISIKALNKTRKAAKPAIKIPEKIEIAAKLMQKVGVLIEKLRKKHPATPDLHFSCDSGYSCAHLLAIAKGSHLIYISVAQKSHYITIEGKKIRIKDWVEDQFKAAESAHNTAQKDLPTDEQTAFTLRIRCHYEAIKEDVTILAFRLVNSNKVTVVYSPNKNIFSKTLRRHWFARTQIEQFFKLLKHYMQIEETRPRNKHKLEYNILRLAFIGTQIQEFIRLLRRKRLLPPNAALGTLRTILATMPFIKDLLLTLLK
jgi:hypothetical protein